MRETERLPLDIALKVEGNDKIVKFLQDKISSRSGDDHVKEKGVVNSTQTIPSAVFEQYHPSVGSIQPKKPKRSLLRRVFPCFEGNKVEASAC